VPEKKSVPEKHCFIKVTIVSEQPNSQLLRGTALKRKTVRKAANP